MCKFSLAVFVLYEKVKILGQSNLIVVIGFFWILNSFELDVWSLQACYKERFVVDHFWDLKGWKN